MNKIHIKNFFTENNIDLSQVSLGDFDQIGEYTAKKMRNKGDKLYDSVGAFYRPNYERMILIHELIKRFEIQSYLEIGFGRGASAIAAAKALYEINAKFGVITIDPIFDENHLKMISQIFPKQWIERIQFVKGTSQEMLPYVTKENQIFDMIYCDGDHRAEATQIDWDLSKDHFSKFYLFDDYHYPDKKETDIECAQVINKIDWEKENCKEPQCIILDRRIFLDDRGYTDQEVNYGQVLFQKNISTTTNDW